MYGVKLDPAAIMQESMEIIEGYMQGMDLPAGQKSIIKRVVHTTGDPALVDWVKFAPGAVETGVAALQKGCNIYTDVNMVSCGINSRLLKKTGSRVNCGIASPAAAEKAKAEGITRAAAALQEHAGDIDGQLAVIGNAPTALFQLLYMAREGIARPALVIGVPVGFVGARESKEALMESGLCYITLPGTRGGSPVAAAVVNALLNLSVEKAN